MRRLLPVLWFAVGGILQAADAPDDTAADGPATAAALGKTARSGVVRVEQWTARPEKARRSVGTGFFVEEDHPDKDWILTVVPQWNESDTFQVEISRNMTEARLVARDPELWLAVLSVPAQSEKTSLRLAKNAPQDGGAPVYVLDAGSGAGEPAAAGRYACREVLGSMLPGVLRIHVPLHHGGGGAPLFNAAEQIAGIVLRPVATSQPNAFLAVPCEVAAKFLSDVRRSRQLSRSWLGVYIDESVRTPSIVGVTRDGPAAAAEIHPGDVVVSVAGCAISSVQSLIDAIFLLEPDVAVDIRVLRGTEIKSLKITPRIKQRRET